MADHALPEVTANFEQSGKGQESEKGKGKGKDTATEGKGMKGELQKGALGKGKEAAQTIAVQSGKGAAQTIAVQDGKGAAQTFAVQNGKGAAQTISPTAVFNAVQNVLVHVQRLNDNNQRLNDDVQKLSDNVQKLIEKVDQIQFQSYVNQQLLERIESQQHTTAASSSWQPMQTAEMPPATTPPATMIPPSTTPPAAMPPSTMPDAEPARFTPQTADLPAEGFGALSLATWPAPPPGVLPLIPEEQRCFYYGKDTCTGWAQLSAKRLSARSGRYPKLCLVCFRWLLTHVPPVLDPHHGNGGASPL